MSQKSPKQNPQPNPNPPSSPKSLTKRTRPAHRHSPQPSTPDSISGSPYRTPQTANRSHTPTREDSYETTLWLLDNTWPLRRPPSPPRVPLEEIPDSFWELESLDGPLASPIQSDVSRKRSGTDGDDEFSDSDSEYSQDEDEDEDENDNDNDGREERNSPHHKTHDTTPNKQASPPPPTKHVEEEEKQRSTSSGNRATQFPSSENVPLDILGRGYFSRNRRLHDFLSFPPPTSPSTSPSPRSVRNSHIRRGKLRARSEISMVPDHCAEWSAAEYRSIVVSEYRKHQRDFERRDLEGWGVGRGLLVYLMGVCVVVCYVGGVFVGVGV